MNLATLEIAQDEAEERLAEYTAAVKAERNAEDEAIAAAYRAAVRGLPIISLSTAVAAGGFFDNGLPRIAVCRADATSCRVDWEDRDRLVFRDDQRAQQPFEEGHEGACARVCNDCNGSTYCWACGGPSDDDMGTGCGECDGTGYCHACYEGMVVDDVWISPSEVA